MNFKEHIYSLYQTLLQEKIKHIHRTLQDLGNSAANETKSTAGDKHETALAMLQLEQENKRKQLNELLLQQATLNKIDPSIVCPYVLNGSLVATDKGFFFICVALGKIEYAENTIFALSAAAPLGQKMMGRYAGESVELNGRAYKILRVE